jgi:miniconductance mechanosensitive channel
MADIFDHIIASIAYFDLEIYEMPTDRMTLEE